jgi:hypothetical protein
VSLNNFIGIALQKVAYVWNKYRKKRWAIKHFFLQFAPSSLYWPDARHTLGRFSRQVRNIMDYPEDTKFISWRLTDQYRSALNMIRLSPATRKCFIELIEHTAGRRLTWRERLRSDGELFAALQTVFSSYSLWYQWSFRRDFSYNHPSSRYFRVGQLLQDGGLVAYLDARIQLLEMGIVENHSSTKSKEDAIQCEVTNFMYVWIMHYLYLEIEHDEHVEQILNRIAQLTNDPFLHGCRCYGCVKGNRRHRLLEMVGI